ncbi:hypothetical protein [Compostimonas suwonensis]|nr:hypothetical protein [Compostimonas suwonensis]
MENDSEHASAPVSPAHRAAEQLAARRRMRELSETTTSPRAYALLTLSAALMTAVFVTVYLIAFTGHASGRNGNVYAGYSLFILPIVPELMFTGLLAGARERFSVRRRRGVAGVGTALVFAGFLVLLLLGISQIAYPWWINPVFGVVAFLLLGGPPLRRLVLERTQAGYASERRSSERWSSEPLSPGIRTMTALIGVYLGALAAMSSQPWFPYVGMAAVLVLVIWGLPFGLPRAGYEWGPLCWGAFGLSTAILFGLTLALMRTDWVTPTVAVITGIAIALVMIAASMAASLIDAPIAPARPGKG